MVAWSEAYCANTGNRESIETSIVVDLLRLGVELTSGRAWWLAAHLTECDCETGNRPAGILQEQDVALKNQE